MSAYTLPLSTSLAWTVNLLTNIVLTMWACVRAVWACCALSLSFWNWHQLVHVKLLQYTLWACQKHQQNYANVSRVLHIYIFATIVSINRSLILVRYSCAMFIHHHTQRIDNCSHTDPFWHKLFKNEQKNYLLAWQWHAPWWSQKGLPCSHGGQLAGLQSWARATTVNRKYRVIL
jgi:hypothetical protein